MTFLSFIISFSFFNLLLLGGQLNSAGWSFTEFKKSFKREESVKVLAFLNFIVLVMLIVVSLLGEST